MKKNMLEVLYPLPAWKPSSRAIFSGVRRWWATFIPFVSRDWVAKYCRNIQRLEEPGRPDFKQSNRGKGTGARIAVPVINIHKTRLNDPFSWFMGTNDQPGIIVEFRLHGVPRYLCQRSG